MNYSQIIKAHYEDDKPLDKIPMTIPERIAWEVLEDLNGRGGFDDWWHAVAECGEENACFAGLVKTIKKVLDR